MDQIVQRIARDLANSPYRELKNIKITAEGNTFVLSGTTSSFYQRQLAQMYAKTHVPNMSATPLVDNIRTH